MEIKSIKPVLTDEVFNFLSSYDIKSSTYIGLHKYEQETMTYIKENYFPFSNKSELINVINAVNQIDSLSKQERVLIIENKPKSLVELSCLVNEYDLKMKDSQVEGLLSVFNRKS